MLTREHIQEDLSRAYIQAVAAKAGVNVALSARAHDYGVDGTFHQVEIRPESRDGKAYGRRCESGFCLDFQAKSSTSWDEKEGEIVYDLEAKTYNDLVSRAKSATPIILILMCLPSDEKQWLVWSEEELLLRKCGYWHRLTGERTGNTGTTRIRIPKSQQLDPAAIIGLLESVEAGAFQ